MFFNMIQIIVLYSVVVGIVQALPQYPSSQQGYQSYPTTPVPILNQNAELNPDGSYRHGFQSGNGISVEEQGTIKNKGSPDNEINSVQGYFSYPGLDGAQYTLTYTSDERGFIAQGSHLPTSPPIPEEILKVLDSQPKDNTEYDERGFPIGSNSAFNGRA
ncbi:hypothetical protein PGB90_008552 [Kerria lacca]